MDLSTLALFSLHAAALLAPLSLTLPSALPLPLPVLPLPLPPPPTYRISSTSATVAGATSACLTNSAWALVRLDAAWAQASMRAIVI